VIISSPYTRAVQSSAILSKELGIYTNGFLIKHFNRKKVKGLEKDATEFD